MKLRVQHLTLFFILLIALTGCDDVATTSPTQGPKTPAGIINTSPGIETPHGPIIPDSAKDLGNGQVQYETEQGTFQAQTTPTAEGRVRFSNPQQVESKSDE